MGRQKTSTGIIDNVQWKSGNQSNLSHHTIRKAQDKWASTLQFWIMIIAFWLVSALFLTLISTHGCCLNTSPLLFFICCPSKMLNLAIYGTTQAILTLLTFLQLQTHWAKQLLLFGIAEWYGMQQFLPFKDPWRIFKNEAFVIMLLLRIRFCSNIHGQNRCFLLSVLEKNVLDVSRPTGYGLLVAISDTFHLPLH